MRLLLLDLDGTVRESASGAKFINKPDDQVLIDGALKAIRAYQSAGWAYKPRGCRSRIQDT